LGADGSIYVADQRVGGVVRYNAYGVQQQLIKTAAAPAGLAFAQDGALLVSQSNFVARYNASTGQEMGRFSNAQMVLPNGIAVDDVTGYVYVADSKASQVFVFTASGSYVNAFGKGVRADSGGASVQNPDGKLAMPTGISFEKISRQLAVADTLGGKVQFFDVNGNFVKSVGNVLPWSTTSYYSKAIVPMQFINPSAVVFEYSKDLVPVLSRMYVVDAFQGNVQVVDPVTATAVNVAGSVNNYIGGSGTANGKLLSPVDAAFDSANSRLLVVNGIGNVAIYGINGGVSPVYVAEVPPVDPVVPPVVDSAPELVVAPAATLTKIPTLLVSGTVTSGSTVSILNQATSKSGEAKVVGSAWSYEVALVEGANALTVTAQNAQNAKAVASTFVTLDSLAPSLVVSSLTNNSYTSKQVQNISGSVTDYSAVTVAVNGILADLKSNEFSVPVSLVAGANQVIVVATDAAGNSVADTRLINFDASKPIVTVQGLVDNSYTASSTQLIGGTVDRAAIIKVNGVPALMNGLDWNASVNLQAGMNTIEVVAVDQSDNSSSEKRTIIFDAVKPEISVVSPVQDLAVNVPNVLVSGVVSDATTIKLEYSFEKSTESIPVAVNDGRYSFNIDFATEGNYPISITVKDAAGNSSTAIRNVIYDKTPPAFALNPVNGVMPEKLSGSVEQGSTVIVKDGAKQIGAVANNNGSWSADLTGINYAPENLIVVATDAAGNSTSKTLSYNFPDGTLGSTGVPTVQDALRAIRLVVNNNTPTAQELAHYDIGPLVSGKPNPNGKIEIVDAILILRKALGLKSW
jgi:hypothetical protein